MPAFGLMGVVMALANTALWSGPFVAVIVVLRSRSVRDAMVR